MMLGISSLKTFVILYHLAEKCLNFPKTNGHYYQFHSATFLVNVESVCALSLRSSSTSRALLREVLDFRIFLATDVAVPGVAIIIPTVGVVPITRWFKGKGLQEHSCSVRDLAYAFSKATTKQRLGSNWFIFYTLVHSPW